MVLTEWLEAQGILASQFAKQLNRAPSTITRVLRGERRVGRDLGDEIERATEGAVRWQDLRPDLFPPEGRAA